MASQIINAAPMNIFLGTQDKSTRQVTPEAESVPQHLVKSYIYAQKGPTTPQLVGPAARTLIYGLDSFDPRKEYHNHATELNNVIVAEGSSIMVQRVVPEDAGPESNILLSLDVLPTTVDIFERNVDGSFKLDATTGDKIVTGTTTGYKVKVVTTNITTKADMATRFGKATITPGDQVDATTGTQSQRYPLIELKASSPGKVFNLSGIRIWAPTNQTTAFNSNVFSKLKAYPFMMSVIQRPESIVTPKVVNNIWGENASMFVLKEGAIDPSTDKVIDIKTNTITQYSSINNQPYPDVYGDIGQMAVYQANIDTLLDMFYTAEAPRTFPTSDFTNGSTDEMYKFNIFTGTNSSGAAYDTYQVISGGVNLNEYTNVYLAGGSDGTMTDAAFATLVENEVARYADENDPIQDLAWNVESILYDSGFPLATKKKLAQFIAVRPDTFVVMGTHEAGAPELTASEDHSVAVSLRTFLQFYPESTFFGTPVCRGLIMGRSGFRRNSQYNKRIPYTFEVAAKATRYMGAGNGNWKSGFNFDGAPGSLITSMYGSTVVWTPSTVRNKDWDVSLNWIQRFDRSSYFIPALKTVYTDDTSVLNSFTTAMALTQIAKVQDRCWRNFSGTDSLTDAQFIDRVNKFMESNLAGRFDGRFVMKAESFYTSRDEQRGYSYNNVIKLYAKSLKTVQVSYVQAFRMSDLGNK